MNVFWIDSFQFFPFSMPYLSKRKTQLLTPHPSYSKAMLPLLNVIASITWDRNQLSDALARRKSSLLATNLEAKWARSSAHLM
jgi:hypothetical protein